MSCAITCIDPRADMPSVLKMHTGDAFVTLMNMGHTTDKPVLIEILRTRRTDHPNEIALGGIAQLSETQDAPRNAGSFP